MSGDADRLAKAAERALAGNLEKGGEKLASQGKLFVRDRLALLLDAGSFVEDALLANASAQDLPADGVVTGVGTVDGRPVCVMANDPTVKAGSPGAGAQAGSSTTRSASRGRSRRSAACSGRRPRAGRTSRASATS